MPLIPFNEMEPISDEFKKSLYNFLNPDRLCVEGSFSVGKTNNSIPALEYLKKLGYIKIIFEEVNVIQYMVTPAGRENRDKFKI